MSYEELIDLDKYIINKDGSIISKYWNKPLKNSKATGKEYIMNHLALKTGGSRPFFRHRVIWYYFNGEIPEGMEIDHINTIKSDNRLENLRVVTHADNMNNELTVKKLRDINTGESNPMHGVKLSENRKKEISKQTKQMWSDGIINKSIPVIQMTLDGKFVAEWKSATECARQTEFRQSGIQYACNGGHFDKKRNKWHNCKQYKGFLWKYKKMEDIIYLPLCV